MFLFCLFYSSPSLSYASCTLCCAVDEAEGGFTECSDVVRLHVTMGFCVNDRAKGKKRREGRCLCLYEKMLQTEQGLCL